MSKGRITYIDNAKGILILMMVFGHVFLDDVFVPVTEWIYTFHMPAFFMINGILFHYSHTLNMPFCKVVSKYVYTILIPLIFSECVGALTYIVRYGFTLNIFGFIYNTIHYHFNNGPDWFFVVLFVIDLMFVAIHKTVRSEKWMIVVSALIMTAGYLLPDTHDLLIITRSVTISYGFLCIGYWGVRLFTEFDHRYAAVMAIAVSVMVSWLNGSVSLNIARVNNPLMFTVGAICGTYCTLYVSKRIRSGALAHIGKNSMIVMITHQAIMLPIRFYTGIAEFNILQGAMVFAITILLQFPLIFLINRFLPFCVGRKIEFIQRIRHGERT